MKKIFTKEEIWKICRARTIEILDDNSMNLGLEITLASYDAYILEKIDSLTQEEQENLDTDIENSVNRHRDLWNIFFKQFSDEEAEDEQQEILKELEEKCVADLFEYIEDDDD